MRAALEVLNDPTADEHDKRQARNLLKTEGAKRIVGRLTDDQLAVLEAIEDDARGKPHFDSNQTIAAAARRYADKLDPH